MYQAFKTAFYLLGAGLVVLCGSCADAPILVPDTNADKDTAIDVTVDTTPYTAIDVTVDTTPDTAVDISPDTEPDTTPDTEPDTVEDTTPDTVADTTPDTVADTAGDTATDTAADTAADTVTPTGPCCEKHSEAGCEISACAEAVCALDSFCCKTSWDQKCANCAGGGKSFKGEDCSGLYAVCGCPAPPPPPPPPKTGPCCENHDTAGCEIDACSAAVCAIDSYCCATKWDENCVKCASGGTAITGQDCSGLQAVCQCATLPPEGPTHFELAEHWAPVWYQDTDDTDAKADYIVAYDYDGNDVSSDNWENLHKAGSDLSAVIYWSVIETETHWFIVYADFHPRDWTENCTTVFSEPCHENDMEGAMVVVRKNGAEFGGFEVLYTEAHDKLHIFVNSSAIKNGSTNIENPGVTFENKSHPELYVESKGHGVCALYYDGKEHCEHPVGAVPPPFPGGDGMVYRYKGIAETPTSGNDKDVGYKLVSLETTLWAKRFDICAGTCLFDSTFTYDGVTLSKAFDGDTYGDDKANPPWGWDDPGDGPVYRGDFFLRPAKALASHVSMPLPISQKYLYNPFLFQLQ